MDAYGNYNARLLRVGSVNIGVENSGSPVDMTLWEDAVAQFSRNDAQAQRNLPRLRSSIGEISQLPNCVLILLTSAFDGIVSSDSDALIDGVKSVRWDVAMFIDDLGQNVSAENLQPYRALHTDTAIVVAGGSQMLQLARGPLSRLDRGQIKRHERVLLWRLCETDSKKLKSTMQSVFGSEGLQREELTNAVTYVFVVLISDERHAALLEAAVDGVNAMNVLAHNNQLVVLPICKFFF